MQTRAAIHIRRTEVGVNSIGTGVWVAGILHLISGSSRLLRSIVTTTEPSFQPLSVLFPDIMCLLDVSLSYFYNSQIFIFFIIVSVFMTCNTKSLMLTFNWFWHHNHAHVMLNLIEKCVCFSDLELTVSLYISLSHVLCILLDKITLQWPISVQATGRGTHPLL